MKIFKYIVSTTLRVSLIFLMFFIWLRYYVKSLILVLILTSILTLIFDGILNYLIKRKNLKANLKKDEIARADGFCNYFIFNDKLVALNFFYDMLTQKYSVIKRRNFILYQDKNCNNIQNSAIKTFEKKDNKIRASILFPYYKFEKFNVEDLIFIINSINKENYGKLIVCTNDIDEKVKNVSLSLSKKIIFLNRYEVYENLMKEFNFYPTELLNFHIKPKMTFKNFLDISLNKKRTTGYIFASFILLISSFFVKITIYYLIMSSILLLLSIFSFINPIFNQKIQKVNI